MQKIIANTYIFPTIAGTRKNMYILSITLMSRLEDFANVLQKFFQTCYKTGVNEYARGEERKD